MTTAQLAAGERSAFRQFVEAVHDFSDDPGPDNLERYLAASRTLDASRQSAGRRRPAARRSTRPAA